MRNHLGFTVTGFVNGANETGSYVECMVTVAAAGAVPVTVRYSNGTTTSLWGSRTQSRAATRAKSGSSGLGGVWN
jgi:hypothetical protein